MTNGSVKFSFVVPAYNEEGSLAGCIEAMRAQKGGYDYEIIVVDNNSTDATATSARELGATVIKEFRQGVGAARRVGTEAAQGEFVVQLDADTRLPADYLLEVEKRFKADAGLVCLSGQFFYYDAPWWKNWMRAPFFHFFRLFAMVISRGRVGPTGNNMVFRKSDYLRTCGFDPSLKFGEDMDLSRQLSVLGRVRLDASLKCYASVRRFKINRKLFSYAGNFFHMCFTGRPRCNELPPAAEL